MHGFRRLAPRLAPTVPLSLAALLARAEGWDAAAAASAAALVALAAAPPRLGWARRIGLAATAAAAAGTPGAATLALGLLPVAANLLLAWHFGATLRPGAEPLIARYTRCDFGRVPAECAPYARRLTALWTAVFAALALLNALPPVSGAVTAGEALGWNAAAVATLFLGEHLVRSLRFPQYGFASPLRTCRAM